jgi:hypothetical protein
VLRSAEREAEIESIKFIDAFKNKRKHIFRDLKQNGDEDLYDKYEDELM